MLTTWNSFPLLDRLLDDVMAGTSGTSLGSPTAARAFSPTVDVRANDEELVFTADVPGVRLDELDISLEDRVLTLKGQRRYNGDGKDKVWLERSYGSFVRSFTLPETVDPERLSADLADGVLTIRIAQAPKAKPRKVTISPRAAGPQLSDRSKDSKDG